MKWIIMFFGICVLLGAAAPALQNKQPSRHRPYVFEIQYIKTDEGMLRVDAVGKNLSNTQQAFYYTLKTLRSGADGKSSTTQSGNVLLLPGAMKVFSTVKINLGAKDTCSVRLEIWQNGVLIEKIASTYPSKEEQ